MLVVQADSFNTSNIGTIVASVITSNPRLGAAPGNVTLPRGVSRLPKDSIVNVSQVVTLDRSALGERVASLDRETMDEVAAGLRLVLDL